MVIRLLNCKIKVFSKIINNSDIMKALIVDNANFINVTPTSQQQELLNNPQTLIRQQIFPYRKSNFSRRKCKILYNICLDRF